jgi:hypothetical protein
MYSKIRLFSAACLIAAFSVSASAQMQVVYNSLPKDLPGNVASEGPEAYAFAELGDGLGLTATTGTLGKVTIAMSSWACQTGNWFLGNCVSADGATFSQPITVNVYAVSGTSSSTLLATTTQSFNIPFRPTSTPALCNSDASRWYSKQEKTCYHGIATQISVNFAEFHAAIPADGKIIVTAAYNTTHYGPAPIGQTACNTTSAGCPYDSLNIGTEGNGPTGLDTGVGSLIDTNGIFVNYTLPANACPGNTTTGILGLDTPCWTGFHPLIQVSVNTNPIHNAKGNKP